MRICEYGCDQEAKYQFKNGKWCCSKSHQSCLFLRSRMSKNRKDKKKNLIHRQRIRESLTGKLLSKEHRQKLKDSWEKTKEYRSLKISEGSKKISKHKRKNMGAKKDTIQIIQKKYPFFSKVEEMRYNPDKPDEIQVRCKNHKCINSKEKEGWFTPTYIQLYERIRQLENSNGNGASYLYCSNKCKIECPLYNKKIIQLIKKDQIEEKYYTQEEYNMWRKEVLKINRNQCEYCGQKAEHVHHLRPQKLEPFFSLDPDFGIACCKVCHYKYGHRTNTECSTGNLANKICR